VNLSRPRQRRHRAYARSSALDLFRDARLSRKLRNCCRTTISVAGEAYRAAVWCPGAKSLLSAEFCGRSGGNEPRKLRQKLLSQALLHGCSPRERERVRVPFAASERGRSESSFDFSGKILGARFLFLLPVTDQSRFLY